MGRYKESLVSEKVGREGAGGGKGAVMQGPSLTTFHKAGRCPHRLWPTATTEEQTPLPVFIAEHLFDQLVSPGNRESLNAVQAPPSKSLNAGGLTDTVLITNPNHSTILAAVKKINFIPAKLSTGTKNCLCQFFHQNVKGWLTEKLVIHGINVKITNVTLFPEVQGKIWFHYIVKIIPPIQTPYICYIFWASRGQVKDSRLAIM